MSGRHPMSGPPAMQDERGHEACRYMPNESRDSSLRIDATIWLALQINRARIDVRRAARDPGATRWIPLRPAGYDCLCRPEDLGITMASDLVVATIHGTGPTKAGYSERFQGGVRKGLARRGHDPARVYFEEIRSMPTTSSGGRCVRRPSRT
jgi:hypothetical protein